MKSEVLEFLTNEEDFALFKNKEEFKQAYPDKKPGEYRPRPNWNPDKYPCLAKEIDFYHNPNGQDEYIMYYIYNV